MGIFITSKALCKCIATGHSHPPQWEQMSQILGLNIVKCSSRDIATPADYAKAQVKILTGDSLIPFSVPLCCLAEQWEFRYFSSTTCLENCIFPFIFLSTSFCFRKQLDSSCHSEVFILLAVDPKKQIKGMTIAD